MKYIRAQAVRRFAKDHNRQVSRLFLEALDRSVERMLIFAVRLWDGHHKRMDAHLIPNNFRITSEKKEGEKDV